MGVTYVFVTQNVRGIINSQTIHKALHARLYVGLFGRGHTINSMEFSRNIDLVLRQSQATKSNFSRKSLTVRHPSVVAGLAVSKMSLSRNETIATTARYRAFDCLKQHSD